MKKLISLSLSLLIALSLIAFPFSQQALAAHAYVTIEKVNCGPTPGDKELYLTWKSKDEVPSIPEVNEDVQIWPTDAPLYWQCQNNQVIEPNAKTQFPVDLEMLMSLWDDDKVAGGEDNIDDKISSAVLTPAQNVRGTLEFPGNEGGSIDYLISFE
ncbi:hypothetical protein PCC7424_4859 [Gloeothece citriformis PCC 7424]|uniref:Uncharacterized protein n=1 Tax=Gloeothece citriformis (strain PCC 7424) TaxID=65393 RepID=B7KE98_GLOC7|nr:hypothetical protein [Gloeothece citriformis]ACK73216.1 hypothetical protein PCC7424_4859 [Gloeothece citriformis PCC 7424]